MLFDDVFYPGNPRRRQEVQACSARLQNAYMDYHDAWNKWATLLNAAFSQCAVEKFSKIHIDLLKCNIKNDTLGICLTEIQTLAGKADDTLKGIIQAMGIESVLPTGWETSGIKPSEMDKSDWLKAGRILSVLGSIGLAGYIGYYVMNGVVAMSALIAVVKGTTIAIGGVIGGAVLGMIVGAAGFVITDMISSAITGAIERKQLKNALEICEQLDNEVTKPLRAAALSLVSACINIQNKKFDLGDNYFLVGNEDGSYEIIIETVVTATVVADPKTGKTIKQRCVKRESIPFIPAA